MGTEAIDKKLKEAKAKLASLKTQLSGAKKAGNKASIESLEGDIRTAVSAVNKLVDERNAAIKKEQADWDKAHPKDGKPEADTTKKTEKKKPSLLDQAADKIGSYFSSTAAVEKTKSKVEWNKYREKMIMADKPYLTYDEWKDK